MKEQEREIDLVVREAAEVAEVADIGAVSEETQGVNGNQSEANDKFP